MPVEASTLLPLALEEWEKLLECYVSVSRAKMHDSIKFDLLIRLNDEHS